MLYAEEETGPTYALTYHTGRRDDYLCKSHTADQEKRASGMTRTMTKMMMTTTTMTMTMTMKRRMRMKTRK